MTRYQQLQSYIRRKIWALLEVYYSKNAKRQKGYRTNVTTLTWTIKSKNELTSEKMKHTTQKNGYIITETEQKLRR